MHVEEPPVVAVGRRELVEDSAQELVSVDAAAEARQAVDAGEEREDEGVARELAKMLAGTLEGARQIGPEGETHGLHVALLAAAGLPRTLAGPCDRGLRLGGHAAHLERARPSSIRQRKTGIHGERSVERIVGADIARQERVDPRHVILDGARRARAQRQAVAILRRSRAPRSRDARPGTLRPPPRQGPASPVAARSRRAPRGTTRSRACPERGCTW